MFRIVGVKRAAVDFQNDNYEELQSGNVQTILSENDSPIKLIYPYLQRSKIAIIPRFIQKTIFRVFMYFNSQKKFNQEEVDSYLDTGFTWGCACLIFIET